MPTEPTITQIRFNNLLSCLDAAITTLEVVSDGWKTPFLEPAINTMRSLLTSVEVSSNSSVLIELGSLFADGQEEQGGLHKNAGADSRVALRRHPSTLEF
jgi:hypothetical protein